MSYCCYCKAPADGPMLSMGVEMAHVACVIRRLNELLNTDYGGKGELAHIIGSISLGKQEGRREVVDFINSRDVPDFTPHYIWWIDKAKWQAKLKEWGIGD